MELFSKLFITTAAALCLYVPHAAASSEIDKISGFYISRKPYASSSISGTNVSQNELALVFHSDGTMTRNDASAYDSWGLEGGGNFGLFFDQPINGVWEVVSKDSKKVKVRAVMFQYGPGSDYPPASTGLPAYFAGNSQAETVRRCWEFEFSHLKNGKFQKCTGLASSGAVLTPNQDPLSTKIPQGDVAPGSASGPLPVFSRVKIEKTWFKGFPSK